MTVSLKTIDYVFPLYLYPDSDKKDLFSALELESKTPNISPLLLKALSETYGKKAKPDDIFYYLYAILYSNVYRTKYTKFLKIDFPRVPLTKNHKAFLEMAKQGKELVDLHLLKSSALDPPIARFEGKGKGSVEKHSQSF